MSVQNFEIFGLNDERDQLVSDGEEEEDHDGEDHLDVGPGGEAKDAEHEQLATLTHCEHVNLSLRYLTNVVVGGIGRLLHEQEEDPLEHLVAVQRGHGQVQEEPVQDRGRDVVQSIAKEQHGDCLLYTSPSPRD